MARRADVDPGLVRHYFRNKSDLFAAGIVPSGVDPAVSWRGSRPAASTGSGSGC